MYCIIVETGCIRWCTILQELATHAPMMVRVPGLTDKGKRSMAYLLHAMFVLLVIAVKLSQSWNRNSQCLVDQAGLTRPQSTLAKFATGLPLLYLTGRHSHNYAARSRYSEHIDLFPTLAEIAAVHLLAVVYVL